LNLAVSDVFYLHQALIRALKHDDSKELDNYSEIALARIWKAMRFLDQKLQGGNLLKIILACRFNR